MWWPARVPGPVPVGELTPLRTFWRLICSYSGGSPASCFVFLFCFFSAFFGGGAHTRGTWRFPGQGSNRSCSYWPTPQPQPQPRQILHPLSEARDQTPILMDTKSDSFLLSHNRNSLFCFLFFFFVLAAACSGLMWDLGSQTRR